MCWKFKIVFKFELGIKNIIPNKDKRRFSVNFYIQKYICIPESFNNSFRVKNTLSEWENTHIQF